MSSIYFWLQLCSHLGHESLPRSERGVIGEGVDKIDGGFTETVIRYVSHRVSNGSVHILADGVCECLVEELDSRLEAPSAFQGQTPPVQKTFDAMAERFESIDASDEICHGCRITTQSIVEECCLG